MIRDPSDGSVREPPKAEVGIPTSIPMPAAPAVKPPPTAVSGLRQPTRTDAQERMERSREWLKQYQQAVRDANSMNDKGEVTNAGADEKAGRGLRTGSAGVEQQGDRGKAGD